MQTVGIIGRGSFGKFVGDLIQQYSSHLTLAVHDPQSPSPHDASLEQVCQCDIVVVAVPIRYFEDCIIQIAPLLGASSILVEVCTVKQHPLHVLQQHLPDHPWISTHPMFGPYSYAKIGTLKDLRLVVCSHTLSDEQYRQFEVLTRLLQLHVISCTAQQHDQMLAQSLFLTHYLSQIVVTAGLENTQIDTISFGNLMDVVASVRNDTQLFHDVRTYNPYCKEVVRQLEEAKKIVDLGLNE